MAKSKGIIICALFAAIISITAPISVPLGGVPVTLSLFTVALTAFFAGSKKAVVAVMVYMLAGSVGLPVFSGFRGGLGTIMSPTGGFILSYVLVAAILGIRTKTKKGLVIAITSALFVCYALGTMWYMFVSNTSAVTALAVCVVPFVVLDVIKLYGAYVIAKNMRRRIGFI